MAHYGMLRDYRFSEDVDDVRGATVYGLEDEKIGKIEDVIFDHSSGQIRYAVVDSGGWLKSKKFLVLADRILPHSKNADDFVIGVTKQHQKDSERLITPPEELVSSGIGSGATSQGSGSRGGSEDYAAD
jgi:sporulation protein YlmC with PRC-barrel domain